MSQAKKVLILTINPELLTYPFTSINCSPWLHGNYSAHQSQYYKTSTSEILLLLVKRVRKHHHSTQRGILDPFGAQVLRSHMDR